MPNTAAGSWLRKTNWETWLNSRDDNCAPSCPSHCSEFKKVLEHIKECFDPECKVKYCVQTQQYIRHVNQCQIEDCELCAPMKERYYHHAYENAKLASAQLKVTSNYFSCRRRENCWPSCVAVRNWARSTTNSSKRLTINNSERFNWILFCEYAYKNITLVLVWL